MQPNQLNDGKGPRDEHFCDFLKIYCCPSITWRYFVVWLSIFDIIYFIVELAMSTSMNETFLSPSTQAMVSLGAKYPYNIAKGYIWLLITPLFLHANFMHILLNLVCLLMWGTGMEKTLGFKRIALLFFVSGVGGNIFSCLLSDSISVGASTGVMGIISAYIAFMIINWAALEGIPFLRCQMVCITCLIVFYLIFSGLSSSSSIDTYGHVGGFICGILCGFWLIIPIREDGGNRKYKKIGYISIIVFYVAGLLLFYLTRSPVKYNV